MWRRSASHMNPAKQSIGRHFQISLHPSDNGGRFRLVEIAEVGVSN